MAGLDMHPRLDKAQRGGQWHVLGHDGTHKSRDGANRAKFCAARFLVDGVAALPILFIVQHQRHRRGGGKDGERASGRKQRLTLPETSVAHPQGDSAGGDMGCGKRVFADPQEKIERRDD